MSGREERVKTLVTCSLNRLNRLKLRMISLALLSSHRSVRERQMQTA